VFGLQASGYVLKDRAAAELLSAIRAALAGQFYWPDFYRQAGCKATLEPEPAGKGGLHLKTNHLKTNHANCSGAAVSPVGRFTSDTIFMDAQCALDVKMRGARWKEYEEFVCDSRS
jgi:hypothetical protein